MKRLVVLTGAGISADSGLQTFRDAGTGLWEGYDINEVATPEGWLKNPALVLEFYNMRRQNVANAKPNAAHFALAGLQQYFDVHIVTQNIDDLHERAGSTDVLHLHGHIFQMRSEYDEALVQPVTDNMYIGQLAPDGAQMRPNIVWFGEAVPMMEQAIEKALYADIFVIIGTSLQVYPAAGLLNYVPGTTPKFVVDKNIPDQVTHRQIHAVNAHAAIGVPQLADKLIKEYL